MSSYTKLFSTIVSSSVWRESKDTKILWVTLLALSDKEGYVDGSIPGLAHLAGLTIAETITALEVLESPDPFSKTPDDEGRRINTISGGWFIVNRAKYRDQKCTEEQREKDRIRQQEHRTTKATTKPSVVNYDQLRRNGTVFFVATKDRVKIGFSVNHWARVSELKKAHSSAILIGMEKGTNETEAQRHKQFAHLSISDGWFHSAPEILDFAASLTKSGVESISATTDVSQMSHQTEKEKETEKGSLLRRLPARADGPCDLGEDTGISEEELASYLGQSESSNPSPVDTATPARSSPPSPAPLLLASEDDAQPVAGLPWGQIERILKREVPEIGIPAKADRRNGAMAAFWKKHNKSVGAFELLAKKVQASDWLMARNGHDPVNTGRPCTWSWIFGKKDAEWRFDRILDGFYDNEKMNRIRDARAAATAKAALTKVMMACSVDPVAVDLSEMWNGEPRWKQYDKHVNGLVNVIDQKG